jgi:phosphotransacetylase
MRSCRNFRKIREALRVGLPFYHAIVVNEPRVAVVGVQVKRSNIGLQVFRMRNARNVATEQRRDIENFAHLIT